MDFNRPSMGEGAARFWTALFGGITAVGLVAAGIYSLFQYMDLKDKERQDRKKDRDTQQLQIAITEFSAKQSFSAKHLELCSQASGDAGIIASSKDQTKLRSAKEDFWRLYWGPLGIVEEPAVANAMVAFGRCLDGNCDEPITTLSLNLAHACRSESANDFKLNLPSVPDRPPASTEGAGTQ